MQSPSGTARERRTALVAGLLLFALGCLEGHALILAPSHQGQPVVADELVYLFQAQTLARGHLSEPSPPLPEFFEAAHLLVVPRFAAKYLPGHALLLSPFVAMGAPALFPAFALGLFAVCLFCAARAAGLSLWASILAGSLPLCTEPVAQIFGFYLSWTSSLPIAAGALALLFIARREESLRALVFASALAGLAFWIRPFTGVALCIAALFVAARSRQRRWILAALAPLLVWGALTCAVCKSVTGDALLLPWQLYARQYMPFDGPGFGPTNPPPPERALPEHLQPLARAWQRERDAFTLQRALARIPSQLAEVADDQPAAYLAPLALLGLVLAFEALLPLLVFTLAFFLLQLTFYAPTPFYLLDLALPVMLGLAAFADVAARFVQTRLARWHSPLARGGLAIGAALLALWLLSGAVTSLQSIVARTSTSTSTDTSEVARSAEPGAERDRPGASEAAGGAGPRTRSTTSTIEVLLAPAVATRGIVFIRYDPAHPDLELTYNAPDLNGPGALRVHDLGARNGALLAAFPGRPAFLFDVAARALLPLDATSLAPAR